MRWPENYFGESPESACVRGGGAAAFAREREKENEWNVCVFLKMK